MVSLIQYGNGATPTYAGLSEDTKPDAAANGSAFVEMDTGKIYFYDAENGQWRELGASA